MHAACYPVFDKAHPSPRSLPSREVDTIGHLPRRDGRRNHPRLVQFSDTAETFCMSPGLTSAGSSTARTSERHAKCPAGDPSAVFSTTRMLNSPTRRRARSGYRHYDPIARIANEGWLNTLPACLLHRFLFRPVAQDNHPSRPTK